MTTLALNERFDLVEIEEPEASETHGVMYALALLWLFLLGTVLTVVVIHKVTYEPPVRPPFQITQVGSVEGGT